MTLVLEGTPSAGGPRSRRSFWGRFWFFWPLPSWSGFSLFVISARGCSSAGASPSAASPAAPSWRAGRS